jgi:glutamyl-tRNA synthetase
MEGLGINCRKVMPRLYASIDGRAQGLPLCDSIWLLGRDRALARLRAARARLD